MADSADWLHRLRIVGIDLRDPAQVVALADAVAAQGPLDILINNAAQTVRRSPGAYAPLAAAESAPLPERRRCPRCVTLRARQRRAPAALAGSLASVRLAQPTPHGADRARADRRLGLAGADRGRHRDRRRRPRARPAPRTTAGPSVVDEVDPLELLEVQLCNPTAPFILVSRLRAALAASPGAAQLRRQRLGDGGRSSAAATRARATRTPTWPRPR